MGVMEHHMARTIDNEMETLVTKFSPAMLHT